MRLAGVTEEEHFRGIGVQCTPNIGPALPAEGDPITGDAEFTPLPVPVIVPLVFVLVPDVGPVVVSPLVEPLPTPVPVPPPLAPAAATAPLPALLPLVAEFPLPWPTLLEGVVPLHAAPTTSTAHGAAWSQSLRFMRID